MPLPVCRKAANDLYSTNHAHSSMFWQKMRGQRGKYSI